MGYIKHNVIVITSWKEVDVVEARKKAVDIFGSILYPDGEMLVSEILESVVNSQRSFFIAPDGSKEGWDTSDLGDSAREEFLNWLQESDNYCDYAEVRFGGDDEYAAVIRDKDSDLNQ